ncbi:MAG TPA: LLM class flavin-dependent oxidoreductase [Alphaproteobacteria bacterium]|nr:LLM class flavin-dependent oxidoreductase [Alphaproteobacteria bacterium]
MVRIGFALSRGLPPSDIVECVKLAEELGYESAWVAEGHGGDQFAILSACAMATKRIRLGTSISSVFVRSIPTIAMAAATVDQLSNGRFILGLGSSHRVQVEPEHGIPYRKPIQRLRESVEVIRTLLRQGSVSYKGEIISIEAFDLWFTPLRPEIPIYLAALFPKMLQVCGEIAQGVILTWSTLEAGRRAAENIAIGAQRVGRRVEEVDIASLLPCYVTADRRQAFDAMRSSVAFYGGFFPRYNRLMAESGFADAAHAIKAAWDRAGLEAATQMVPDALIEAISISGPPSDCRERVEAYRCSGISLPIISPRPSGPNPKQMVLEALQACAP